MQAAEKAFQINAFDEANEYATKAISLSDRKDHPDPDLRWIAFRIHVQSLEIIGSKDGFNPILKKIFDELNSCKLAQSDAKARLWSALSISFAKLDNFDDATLCVKMRAFSMRARSLQNLKMPMHMPS